MRNPIKWIKELLAIRKYITGTLVKDNPEIYQYDRIIHMLKKVKRDKYPQYARDGIAKALKLHRSYKVNEEWADAKVKYLQYQIDHPDVYKSADEVPVDGWVTVVGHAPVRGERYNEYYAGDWGGIESGTYKVKGPHKYSITPSIALYSGDRWNDFYKEYNEMRPATEEEIESAKYQYWTEHDKAQESRYNGYLEQKQMVTDQYSWLGTRETII